MEPAANYQCDVLVVGSGAAGLTTALQLADTLKVTVLSKSALTEGSTFYAQGGIAAVFDKNDSIESHSVRKARTYLQSCAKHKQRSQRQLRKRERLFSLC